MYLDYFGLNEAPFSITPDPAFVYLSHRHRDALAHLMYGIGQGGSGGFVQLTGEVGTGKTTLCRCLLELVPEGTHIALVLNPLMTPRELLATISEELEIDTSGAERSSKLLVDRLNAYLLQMHEAGERVVVVIDEAQVLSPEALEQVRLLTNLETSKEKLLQIVLLGQPELRELLQRRGLRQLAQRVTARYHLTPLGRADSALYVKHRMQVAGAQRNPFRRSALKALYQRSHGVPRLINIIADRALVAAFARERPEINASLVHAAADEVQLGEPGARRSHWPLAGAAAVGVLLSTLSWYALVKPGRAPVEPPVALAGESLQPVAVPAGKENLGQDAPGETATSPLDAQWLDLQNQLAWRGLGASWGNASDALLIEAACNGREGLGYACLRDQGSWGRIQQLGLPVVLVLQGATPEYLLLRGIDNGRVMVGIPEDSRTVERQALEPRWLGAFLVAWPQAPNWPREVGRGDAGPAVDTILALASKAGFTDRGAAAFDSDFENWLVSFQLRNGLDADGIVGPKTLLYLMKSSIDEPRLLSDWDTGS